MTFMNFSKFFSKFKRNNLDIFGSEVSPFSPTLWAPFGLVSYVGIKCMLFMLTGVQQGESAMWICARGKIPNQKPQTYPKLRDL